VRRHGVGVQFTRGGNISPKDVERARAGALIPIPDPLANLYLEVGDGFRFYWDSEGRHEDSERPPFANLEFPRLDEVSIKSLEKLKWKIEWQEPVDYRFTYNPAQLRTTILRMRKWLPILGEGNGDRFCLDTGAAGVPVVFDCHERDIEDDDRSHVVGASLLDFFTAWSRVCFQFPRSLSWPMVWKESGDDIAWASAEFREPFRLPPQ